MEWPFEDEDYVDSAVQVSWAGVGWDGREVRGIGRWGYWAKGWGWMELGGMGSGGEGWVGGWVGVWAGEEWVVFGPGQLNLWK